MHARVIHTYVLNTVDEINVRVGPGKCKKTETIERERQTRRRKGILLKKRWK